MDLTMFCQIMQTNPELFVTLATIFGFLIGSFLNVVIVRLPKMLFASMREECEIFLSDSPIDYTVPPKKSLTLWSPSSHCVHCETPIKNKYNVPVFGYLWLRGRAPCCGQRIHWRYPLVECISGLLTLVFALHFGCTWQCLASLIFVWSLIALTFIDFDHQLLPDDITLPLLWLGIIINLAGLFIPLNDAVIGAVAGYSSLWLITAIFKIITGKIGMGHGDFKLYAVIGAWLGWQILPIVILIAAFLGTIVGISMIIIQRQHRQKPIPFGPYLAIAGIIALFFGQEINHYYLQILLV